MAKEIIINAEKDQSRIAIVDRGELAELHFETPENERTIGDIYLGQVRRVMPSIQAAFVDIGQEQDAFLHFSDLADNLPELLEFLNADNPKVGDGTSSSKSAKGKRRRPQRNSGNGAKNNKQGKKQNGAARAEERGKRRSAQRRSKKKRRSNLEKHLKRGQRILVKVTKEPISNKGSRISTNISLAGRFLVLVPLAEYTAVSKKISSHKERRRLRALAKSLLPDKFGLIVRTAAAGRDAKTLDTDLRLLLEKWHKIENKLAGRPDPPLKVHEDVNMASSIIRDLFSEDYDRILVDHPRLYRKIKGYIKAVAPQMVPAVQLHQGNEHVFESIGIAKDIDEVFDSRVELPSGGYLFIEQTEAMHVIDVNSGRSGRGKSQEENSLQVNLEAARTIAKQVRLRDLGGIIVVDFIDLRSNKNKRKVYQELKKEFRRDRAVTKILPMSDFGLVQITRQRLRPSLTKRFSRPDVNGESEQPSSPSSKEKQPEKPKRSTASKQPKNAENPNDKASEQRESKDAPQTRRAPSRRPVKPSSDPEEMLEEMEEWLTIYKAHGNRRTVVLRVHPFTAAYLNRKVPNHPTRWFMKHLIRVRLETDETLSPMSYRFIDAHTGNDVTDRINKSRENLQEKS